LQTQEIDKSKSSQNFKFSGQKIGCPIPFVGTAMLDSQSASNALVPKWKILFFLESIQHLSMF